MKIVWIINVYLIVNVIENLIGLFGIGSKESISYIIKFFIIFMLS